MITGQDLWDWQQQAKQTAAAVSVDPGEVDWLLQGLIGLDRLSLRLGTYRGQGAIATQWDRAALDRLWQQRLEARVPVQYLAGQMVWRHLRLMVGPAVLIPRPETELMIEIACEQVAQSSPLATGVWVDLGTGSGAIALGLAQALPGAIVHGVDCSAAALAIARQNGELNGLSDRVTWHHGPWWHPLHHQAGTIAAMVSNPPYIPSRDLAQLQPEVRDHEPHLALDGGDDGLTALRHLITTAPQFLKPDGLWLVELMAGQAPTVADLLRAQGQYHRIQLYSDLAGIERFVLAYTLP
ncbi:peptide chain release factor N(5)-glutamine methyltransferase [Spirulina major CS-329]|uniref:peptide chain release factor N(5)-glutamine methyltransferase n=1 Tax=Spirulina TaxID=1154 RepID=UPI00232D4B16|nr:MULTISPECIES: peptide chain release factor N(5)-glutamine methyltransferase [Spirulina]MDB9495000.1 peptide chain release factor N(5)-glutamine methyltransferase [Spirulina subsalsa CS-330]MDB9502621.1 peptide chain release factor N(5)-glutamine methyltransferase [Spirulina major CS-329]